MRIEQGQLEVIEVIIIAREPDHGHLKTTDICRSSWWLSLPCAYEDCYHAYHSHFLPWQQRQSSGSTDPVVWWHWPNNRRHRGYCPGCLLFFPLSHIFSRTQNEDHATEKNGVGWFLFRKSKATNLLGTVLEFNEKHFFRLQLWRVWSNIIRWRTIDTFLLTK